MQVSEVAAQAQSTFPMSANYKNGRSHQLELLLLKELEVVASDSS